MRASLTEDSFGMRVGFPYPAAVLRWGMPERRTVTCLEAESGSLSDVGTKWWPRPLSGHRDLVVITCARSGAGEPVFTSTHWLIVVLPHTASWSLGMSRNREVKNSSRITRLFIPRQPANTMRG